MDYSGYVAVDGGRLYVEAVGAGPALVLIHGSSVDMRMWDEPTAELASTYSVIRYDLRGLGKSEPPAAPYRMTDDVGAVLDHLDVDAAALVGFSTGGGVAAEFAATNPERTTALTLVGAVVEPDPADTAAPGLEAAREELMILLAPREAAREQADLSAAVTADLDVWASAHHGAARARLRDWGIANPYFHFGMFKHEKLGLLGEATLGKVTAPTLVIVGDKDIALARRAAEHLAAAIPGARLQVFPGADHYVSTAQPQAFTAALRTFLAASIPSTAI